MEEKKPIAIISEDAARTVRYVFTVRIVYVMTNSSEIISYTSGN